MTLLLHGDHLRIISSLRNGTILEVTKIKELWLIFELVTVYIFLEHGRVFRTQDCIDQRDRIVHLTTRTLNPSCAPLDTIVAGSGLTTWSNETSGSAYHKFQRHATCVLSGIEAGRNMISRLKIRRIDRPTDKSVLDPLEPSWIELWVTIICFQLFLVVGR